MDERKVPGDFMGLRRGNQGGNPCLFSGIKENYEGQKTKAEGSCIGLIGV